MTQLKITPDLLVGHEQIDAEHEMICELINRIASAVGCGAPVDEIDVICTELKTALQKHFDDEHLIMSAVGYPNADRHDQHHEQELAEIAKQMARFINGEIPGDALVHYLFVHFANHVRFEDRRLGDFIAAQLVATQGSNG